jgi:hypothetical protein
MLSTTRASFFPAFFSVRLDQNSLVQSVAKKVLACWGVFENALKNLYGFSRSLIGRITKPRPTLVTLLMAKLEAEAAAKAASDLTSCIAEALNQERSKVAGLAAAKEFSLQLQQTVAEEEQAATEALLEANAAFKAAQRLTALFQSAPTLKGGLKVLTIAAGEYYAAEQRASFAYTQAHLSAAIGDSR